MPPRRSHLVVSLCVVFIACAGSHGGRAVDVSSLPVYLAEEQPLFDDSLSRAVFGLPRAGVALDEDPDFVTRLRLADSVSVMKVSTTTSDNNGDRPMYHLVLHPEGAAFVGATLPGDPIEVDIAQRDPAVALLHASGDTLSGVALIVFLKRYKDHGQAIVHFHAEPDTSEVRAAITKAKPKRDQD